jgi:hypothetical protein
MQVPLFSLGGTETIGTSVFDLREACEATPAAEQRLCRFAHGLMPGGELAEARICRGGQCIGLAAELHHASRPSIISPIPFTVPGSAMRRRATARIGGI